MEAFLTTPMDGGEQSPSRSGNLSPGNGPRVPTGYESEWAPQLA